MTPALRAVKGMNDVLPDDAPRWHRLEAAFTKTMALHAFREVRTPCVESTSLFVRAMGETTDVVEKETYAFVHHDQPLTLRPEATAGVARAYLEHGVHKSEPISRWFYMGPMFRAENPQRGRYRQFHQAGAEIFGDAGPACDAELIDMLTVFLNGLGIADAEVVVNSLGGPAARVRYREALTAFLAPRRGDLSVESQRRLETNPLRILDSKDVKDHEALKGGPTLADFLEDADREHFAAVCSLLDALGTPYRVDPYLVRGLDYYTRTLFEIKGAKAKLGAGSTLVGGGRYDNLLADLGGPSIPAVGFAAGMERLLIATEGDEAPATLEAFIAPLGDTMMPEALKLGKDLRAAGIHCEVGTRGGSLKSLLRRANTVHAKYAIVLGESEAARNVVQLKDLDAHTQEEVTWADAPRIIRERLSTVGAGETP